MRLSRASLSRIANARSSYRYWSITLGGSRAQSPRVTSIGHRIIWHSLIFAVPESLGVKNVTFCLFSEPIFNGLEMAPEVPSSVVMSFLADLSATYRQSFETESLFGT